MAVLLQAGATSSISPSMSRRGWWAERPSTPTETPLTDEVLALAKSSDAVVLGAMGGPKWDGLDYSIRPERALLALRQELGLFANLRPVKLFAPLAQASTLKPEVVAGTDLLVVRELTGGIYFGQPKGVTTEPDWSTPRPEIERIARVAFDAAAGAAAG
ncbi:3-isopropylmalate dehydrogenase [Geodia barretti]|uniref:3-isopropylmalate dehydrogenase n=1 Tax=Geodia barretti TaxID=519541 RepID=A0AA35X4R1_GEOBA|nr:3-isopropylmalate dehydrogenase [Geodia barretti]